MKVLFLCVFGITASSTSAFSPTTNTPSLHHRQRSQSQPQSQTSLYATPNDTTTTTTTTLSKTLLTTTLTLLLTLTTPLLTPPTYAVTSEALGASSAANTKIATGGASTLQSGRTIAVTRGINLDRSDFSNQNLKGVAFQQSIVRDSSFKNSNLVGSSFFDATVDGSDFEGADMTLANVEMAQFNRSILKNTVLREMYVSGSTIFEGVKDIEGSDWSETFLRKDQQKYLCNHPTAKGTNPTTGVDTRESLMCKN